MVRIVLTLSLVLIYTAEILTQNQKESANNLLETLTAEGYAVGAAAGFSIDGKIVWASADGYTDLDTKTEFSVDTKVRIASIAKSMTAIAVMQLVEQGKIDLNKPVDQYIPTFIQKNQTPITVKHLLSHTSGIDGYKNNRERENTIHFETLEAAYDVFKDRELRFEPGTKFHYTSYGYVVLGVLIEHISGLTYEDYMQKHIWNKLDMTQTGIEKRNPAQELTSKLYHCKKKGKLKDVEANNLSNRIPGGGIYSTLSDLLKFGHALLNHSLVSQETIELMTQHHSLEKSNNGYGFGFYLYGTSPKEDSIFGHNGAQTGASSQLFLVPSLQLVTVVVSNTSGSGREVSTVAAKLIDISQMNE